MLLVPVYLLLTSLTYPALCFNHWVVTEDGKIEYQAASPFNLRQPFDLMAFMKQEERVSILKELKDELIEYKNEFELLREFDSFDESFYASEPKCREVKFISTQDLFISTVLPLEHKGIRVRDHLDLFSNPLPGEPFCALTPLQFSMYAMEHLEGVQNRRSLVAPPERGVLTSVDMRMEVFGSLVHHALKKNSTSWVLLNLATLYWRARGHPHHAVDCVRRALHYSPTYSMDIALLNLANILHRSQHSADALAPLLAAISLSPDVNILHYTLGSIYAALNRLNESVASFQRCIDLNPSDETSLTMYLSALCELKKEQASRERTQKLDSTQRKLDQFYENMELVQKLQHPSPKPSVKPSSRRSSRGVLDQDRVSATDAVPASLPTNTPTTHEQHSAPKESVSAHPERLTNTSNLNSSKEEKVRSKHLRLVLKPLPPEELERERRRESRAKNTSLTISRPSLSVCQQRFYWVVLKDWCSTVCLDSQRHSELCWLNPDLDRLGCPVDLCAAEPHVERKRPSIRLKMKPLSEDEEKEPEELSVSKNSNPPPSETKNTPQPSETRDEYPLSYRSLGFMPYNPLPDHLEKVVFPYRSDPLADYDDPYWPRKGPCLELVQEVRANPQMATFPGTFLPPVARGADIKRLFLLLPEELPSTTRQPPYCTDIVELPYSMSAMDHLTTIADRRTLNESKKETALKRVLIDTVSGDREERYSFEESAHRAYAVMLQIGPNWALFNIASLYWRVVGDARNAIECLRRALHFAPDRARDVGLIGMANVLHGLGALDEAVILSRAALDIKTESPVGHYTLASVYATKGDYIAASLHLRAALHISVFSEALLSLKLIRCSLKFKAEQTFLRKRMLKTEGQGENEELVREVAEAVKNKKPIKPRSEPPLILDDIEPPEIPEMKVEGVRSREFTGDDAIQYLTSVSLLRNARLKKLEEKDRKAIEEHLRQPEELMKQLQDKKESKKAASAERKRAISSKVRKTSSPSSTAEVSTTPTPQPQTPSSTVEVSATPTPQPQTVNNTKPDPRKLEEDLDKAANTKESEQSSPPKEPTPRRHRSHEEVREEELKKRFPGTRPWPTVEECTEKPPPRKLVFTSTWLSVTAKGAKIKEFVDFNAPLEHYPLLPYCHNDFEQSRKTLSHLTGMSAHPLAQYKPEKGLQEVLCNMDGNRRSLEEMATRIKHSLAKFPDSWVVSNLAALYWRIVGQGQLAIKCLKHALYFSDDNARDVALVSLANVLYRSGFDMDALSVIHMSLEASPTLVVTHFTMANILAAQGFYVDSSGFYESTLHYQPQFQPAADRLKSVRCLILLARKRVEDTKRKEKEAEGAAVTA